MAGGSYSRRIHARVKTEIGCTLWTEQGEQRGIVMDLSHGGALLQARRGAMKAGQSFEIEVESDTGGEPIAVLAEVLRVEELGMTSTYATRFSLIEPKQEKELRGMIERMAQGPDGTNPQSRIARRVEMQCTTAAEFKSLMKEITDGSIGLQCGTALVLAERVKVALRMPTGHDPLVLQGTVAHVRTIVKKTPQKRPEKKLYHVGIRLDALSSDQSDALNFYQRMFST